jgi:hypothetical protein
MRDGQSASDIVEIAATGHGDWPGVDAGPGTWSEPPHRLKLACARSQYCEANASSNN